MSVVKKRNSRIVDEAHRLASICKHLDFAAIARHEPLAVAQLQQAIQTLSIRVRGEIKLHAGEIDNKATAVTTTHQESALAPVIETLETTQVARKVADTRAESDVTISMVLQQAGFSDRLGMVYDSESKPHIVSFAHVSQRRGLPPFLFVICPDFAPVAGYHGIFITDTEVYAAVFPVNGNGQWQIDACRSYQNLQQMEEWVTLLSAGFALP